MNNNFFEFIKSRKYTSLFTWELWFTMGAAQGFFEVRYIKKRNGQINEYFVEHF